MSFKDIKGQAKPVEILRHALISSSIPGAYLFAGEEGIGKYLTALNLAKAVNCLSAQDDSCDFCISCSKIDKGQHPDVHFIIASDSQAIKIDYIRGLKKEINLKPYEGRKKVFIINDAHQMSPEASNALLKVLEEPPGNSLIILVSSKSALLFKTIVSRCQILKFYPLQKSELEGVLRKDYHIASEPAHLLAYFYEGRIGPALKLKDTDILREKNRIIDEFIIFDRPGFMDSLSLRGRVELRKHLNILASWFRDIYLLKTGIPHSELINLDRKDELLSLMSRYTWLDLDQIFDCIADSLLYLEHNINIKLLVFNLKAELCRG